MLACPIHFFVKRICAYNVIVREEAKVNFRVSNDPKGYLQKAELILDFSMTDADLEEI